MEVVMSMKIIQTLKWMLMVC